MRSMILVAGLALFAASAASAATIVVDVDPGTSAGMVEVADDALCSLREAIDNANNNAQTHEDCEAGEGADTIILPTGAVFTLIDAVVSDDFGNTGLPYITSEITLEGNGATIESGNTCTRDGAQTNEEFRLVLIGSGGNLVAENLTLRNGCADGNNTGGGIRNHANLTLYQVRVEDNQATSGGALFNHNDASAIIESSTFAGNSAGIGGGFLNNVAGSALIEGSTFSNNTASGLGGGIAAIGSVSVRNSTLSGNSASTGGGLYSFSTLTLEQVTFSDNTANNGGGIRIDTGTANVKNVILNASDCTAGSEATGNADGANLDSGTSCANLFGSNFSGEANINLGSLADNGGPTETHALLAGSEALDAATDCTSFAGSETITVDQRGVTRPQGPACDIGSVEAIKKAVIATNVSSLAANVMPNNSTDLTLEIHNVGHVDLEWTIDTAEDPCESFASIPWLTVNPTSATTASGNMDLITVSLDATGLTAPSQHEAYLCVDSNDPNSPTLSLPIWLNVVGDPMFMDRFE